MMPLTKNAHFSTGQQHGQSIHSVVGPHFFSTNFGTVKGEHRHRYVVAYAIEVNRTSDHDS